MFNLFVFAIWIDFLQPRLLSKQQTSCELSKHCIASPRNLWPHASTYGAWPQISYSYDACMAKGRAIDFRLLRSGRLTMTYIHASRYPQESTSTLKPEYVEPEFLTAKFRYCSTKPTIVAIADGISMQKVS